MLWKTKISFALLALLPALSSAGSIERCVKLFSEDKRLAAYETCLPLAQVGDATAAFVLARLHAKGMDGEPDWPKVVEWLTLSAANGHGEAAYNLAIAHERGRGTSVNLAEAINYYQLSAEQGNAKAMRNLAMHYEKGEFFPQDNEMAFQLFQRSAQLGLSDSQLKAGMMLLNGIGVAKDPRAARFWFDSAAQAGNVHAQLALGVFLVDFDPDTALYWYSQAMEQGSPHAAHNLAIFYSEDNARRDLFKALAYADKSIELGNNDSQPLYDRILQQLQALPEAGESPVTRSNMMFDLDWLKRQPADRQVIQLARLESKTSVERFIKLEQLAGKVIAIELKQARDYVVLYNSDFSSVVDARRILNQELASGLRDDAWIRSYSSLY